MAGIRVISGSAKGRRLHMVPGEGTRPVPDRVKEALFNIIGPQIEGAFMLDLFAGTGSVGIEALSRGAERVDFVDRDRRAIHTIQTNLELTHLDEHARVIHKDSFLWLEGKTRLGAYDYVYVAPPQYQKLWSRSVLTLDQDITILHPDAWVIAQIHPKEYEQLTLANLVEFDQRKYGSTLLVFYECPSS
ncbi:MAG: 16S rRNA (guanine(966)-N(2))-methyltransferase RsmD [Anaerolineales bacterium]